MNYNNYNIGDNYMHPPAESYIEQRLKRLEYEIMKLQNFNCSACNELLNLHSSVSLCKNCLDTVSKLSKINKKLKLVR